MKADIVCCYCLGRCMTKLALLNHCVRTLIGLDYQHVRWVYFRENPPPSLKSHLNLSSLGIFSRLGVCNSCHVH